MDRRVPRSSSRSRKVALSADLEQQQANNAQQRRPPLSHKQAGASPAAGAAASVVERAGWVELNAHVAALTHSTSIAVLDISHIVLSEDVWRWLCGVFPLLRVMRTLLLDNLGLDDGRVLELLTALQKPARSSTSTAAASSSFVAPPALQELSLAENAITYRCMNQLGKYVLWNSHCLRALRLCKNRLGDHGAQVLGVWVAKLQWRNARSVMPSLSPSAQRYVITADLEWKRAMRHTHNAQQPSAFELPPFGLDTLDLSNNGLSFRGVSEMTVACSHADSLKLLVLNHNEPPRSVTSSKKGPMSGTTSPVAMRSSTGTSTFPVHLTFPPSAVGGGYASTSLRMASRCSITTLDLSFIQLGLQLTPEGCHQLLMTVLCACPLLQHLRLDGSHDPADAVAAKQATRCGDLFCEVVFQICEDVVHAGRPPPPSLQSLTLLSLSATGLSDDGAKALAYAILNAHLLPNLRVVDVSHNYLSLEGLLDLLEVLLTVTWPRQEESERADHRKSKQNQRSIHMEGNERIATEEELDDLFTAAMHWVAEGGLTRVPDVTIGRFNPPLSAFEEAAQRQLQVEELRAGRTPYVGSPMDPVKLALAARQLQERVEHPVWTLAGYCVSVRGARWPYEGDLVLPVTEGNGGLAPLLGAKPSSQLSPDRIEVSAIPRQPYSQTASPVSRLSVHGGGEGKREEDRVLPSTFLTPGGATSAAGSSPYPSRGLSDYEQLYRQQQQSAQPHYDAANDSNFLNVPPSYGTTAAAAAGSRGATLRGRKVLMSPANFEDPIVVEDGLNHLSSGSHGGRNAAMPSQGNSPTARDPVAMDENDPSFPQQRRSAGGVHDWMQSVSPQTTDTHQPRSPSFGGDTESPYLRDRVSAIERYTASPTKQRLATPTKKRLSPSATEGDATGEPQVTMPPSSSARLPSPQGSPTVQAQPQQPQHQAPQPPAEEVDTATVVSSSVVPGAGGDDTATVVSSTIDDASTVDTLVEDKAARRKRLQAKRQKRLAKQNGEPVPDEDDREGAPTPEPVAEQTPPPVPEPAVNTLAPAAVDVEAFGQAEPDHPVAVAAAPGAVPSDIGRPPYPTRTRIERDRSQLSGRIKNFVLTFYHPVHHLFCCGWRLLLQSEAARTALQEDILDFLQPDDADLEHIVSSVTVTLNSDSNCMDVSVATNERRAIVAQRLQEGANMGTVETNTANCIRTFPRFWPMVMHPEAADCDQELPNWVRAVEERLEHPANAAVAKTMLNSAFPTVAELVHEYHGRESELLALLPPRPLASIVPNGGGGAESSLPQSPQSVTNTVVPPGSALPNLARGPSFDTQEDPSLSTTMVPRDREQTHVFSSSTPVEEVVAPQPQGSPQEPRTPEQAVGAETAPTATPEVVAAEEEIAEGGVQATTLDDDFVARHWSSHILNDSDGAYTHVAVGISLLSKDIPWTVPAAASASASGNNAAGSEEDPEAALSRTPGAAGGRGLWDEHTLTTAAPHRILSWSLPSAPAALLLPLLLPESNDTLDRCTAAVRDALMRASEGTSLWNRMQEKDSDVQDNGEAMTGPTTMGIANDRPSTTTASSPNRPSTSLFDEQQQQQGSATRRNVTQDALRVSDDEEATRSFAERAASRKMANRSLGFMTSPRGTPVRNRSAERGRNNTDSSLVAPTTADASPGGNGSIPAAAAALTPQQQQALEEEHSMARFVQQSTRSMEPILLRRMVNIERMCRGALTTGAIPLMESSRNKIRVCQGKAVIPDTPEIVQQRRQTGYASHGGDDAAPTSVTVSVEWEGLLVIKRDHGMGNKELVRVRPLAYGVSAKMGGPRADVDKGTSLVLHLETLHAEGSGANPEATSSRGRGLDSPSRRLAAAATNYEVITIRLDSAKKVQKALQLLAEWTIRAKEPLTRPPSNSA